MGSFDVAQDDRGGIKTLRMTGRIKTLSLTKNCSLKRQKVAHLFVKILLTQKPKSCSLVLTRDYFFGTIIKKIGDTVWAY
jgi:hypothetical protein